MASHRSDPNDREFNTPAEMLVRLTFLLWIASLPVGMLLTLAGFVSQRWPLLIGGVVTLMAGWGLRDWLRRRGRLEATTEAFDVEPVIGIRAEETRLTRLVALLREWDELERRRGHRDFDPWAVQSVRNEILAVVDRDPALLSLFRAHRQAA